MKGIQTISIIGTGNVAFHLGNSFFEQGLTINAVFGRNKIGDERLIDRDLLYAKSALIQLFIIQSKCSKGQNKTLFVNHKTNRHLNN